VVIIVSDTLIMPQGRILEIYFFNFRPIRIITEIVCQAPLLKLRCRVEPQHFGAARGIFETAMRSSSWRL